MKAVFTDFPLKKIIVTVTQSTGFERLLQKCIAYYNKADLFKASLNIAEHVLFLSSEESVILSQNITTFGDICTYVTKMTAIQFSNEYHALGPVHTNADSFESVYF